MQYPALPNGPASAGSFDSQIDPMILMQYFAQQSRPQGKELPKPAPKLKIDDLKDEWERIRPTFDERNANFQDWRRFTRVEDEYRMGINGRFSATPIDDAPITVTQPAIIVRRRVQKVGTMDLTPKITPGGKTAEDEANAVITNKFMKTARACWDDDYRNGGGSSSRQQAMTQYADEDGHLYSWVRPEKSRPRLPFVTRLLEPSQCYPVFGYRNGVPSLVRFYEVRTQTLRELRDEWGKEIKVKKEEREEDDPIEVLNYADWDYTAIWSPDIEGEWIRKPALHGYGTIPVVASYCGGRPSEYGERRQQNASQREANRGRSVIADHVGVLARLAEMMAALKRALFKAVDPPMHVENGPDDTGVQVPRNPGETVQTGQGTRFNPLVDSPQVTQIAQQIMAMDMESLRLDNLLSNPDLVRASGFDRVVASLEAEETMAELVACIEDHESRVLQTMLTMGQYVRGEEGFQSAMYFDEEGVKGGTYETFDFGIIPDYPHVTCKLETLSNVNRLQLLQQAGRAVPTGLASARTLREWAGIDDSDGEQSRIQEEMARMNPAFVKTMEPADELTGLIARLRQAEQRGNKLEAEIIRILFAKKAEGLLTYLNQPATPPQPQGPPPGMMPPGMDPSMMMQQGGPMGPPSSLPPTVGIPGGIPPEMAGMGMDDMSGALAAAGGVGPMPGGY